MAIDYRAAAQALADILGLATPPLAITFSALQPAGVERFSATMPAPTVDGRTGAVAAGCVFWMKAVERTFATVPADHGNCSVGSLTHGLIPLAEAARRADVVALCEAEWVKPEVFPHIPTVRERPNFITYGPLAATPVAPDVIFLRLNGKQAMMLHDACPDLRFEGKPQCHIIPLAKEQGEIAVSVGCMLSRVRTGMANHELTCALPATQLPAILEALRAASAADKKVAAYAGADGQRFR